MTSLLSRVLNSAFYASRRPGSLGRRTSLGPSNAASEADADVVIRTPAPPRAARPPVPPVPSGVSTKGHHRGMGGPIFVGPYVIPL